MSHLLYSLFYLLLFFFFFQAEDGIRDYKVTGVQTCALPISLAAAAASRRSESPPATRPPCRTAPTARRSSWAIRPSSSPGRSEERRVGKEGRSRWSPYH